jgi:hypothetical protein
MTNSEILQSSPIAFLRQHLAAVMLISLLLIVPCFWHRHIEAGDLPSHVYNAWLAQLVTQGQAPGLYLVHRYDNVLFDMTLFYAANLFGIHAAEKIVVSICVLILVWGVFSLVAAVSRRPPWFLLPCMAMLAYGYVFNMGFFNYYLSIGLASFVLALTWRPRPGNWFLAVLTVPFVLLCHPIGCLWLLGTFAYHRLRERLPGWTKLALPLSTAAAFFALHGVLAYRVTFPVDWQPKPFYLLFGVDQLHLFADGYVTLSWFALALGVACAAGEVFAHRKDRYHFRQFLPALELYAIAVLGSALLPENLRPSVTAGWIGLLVSRVTMITAIFGLCVLGLLGARRRHLAGFGAIAAVFFVFLYQDTARLSRLEANAESILATLPYGTRIIPAIDAPPDSRITFIGHIADRACIHRCFTYSNYEPASEQFRVRVRPEGSPLVTSSENDAEDMEGGGYEVQDTDPPLTLLYQCDPSDTTKLCLHPLKPGDSTEPSDLRPSAPPTSPSNPKR